jgi:tetratricopeptide (TPR) repeat protein
MTENETLSSRVETLQRYLREDPVNETLLADIAAAALGERQPSVVVEMTSRLAQLRALSPNEFAAVATAHLQLNAPDLAIKALEKALAVFPHDPALRFNAAWAQAALRDWDGAMDRLDPVTTTTLPAAAVLHVQLLHRRGDFYQAMEQAKVYAAHHGDDPDLMAAMATLALDLEDKPLAAVCAQKAGQRPEALSALGVLALSDQNTDLAWRFFDEALAVSPAQPRAWIGRGLAELRRGAFDKAADDMSKGAQQFEDHLGSWIGAAWAYLLGGRLAEARNTVANTLKYDQSFAETYGTLAVIDALEGRLEDARRNAEIGSRLDRTSFSARFAQVLIVNAENSPDIAKSMFARLIESPYNSSGDTIADAIAQLSFS